MTYTHKTNCRICSSIDLLCFLKLGEHPPVDNFISAKEVADEKRYPLDVYFCRNCSLVQLLDVVFPEELFHSEYAYFSSASVPLVRHFERYAEDIKKSYLSQGDLVVDIGSNDGVLLQFFSSEHRVLGIEPSGNVALLAQEKGIETVVDFFTTDLAKQLAVSHGKAKVICANNVFAHIDNIAEVIEAVKILLVDNGVYVFEAHYIMDLIEKVEFDTVYHEHLCYYSVKALKYLFDKFDMEIFDVQRVEQHGGSIRVFVCNKSAYSARTAVEELIQLEEKVGLHDENVFLKFQTKVEAVRNELIHLVKTFNAEGKRIVGYGAPAKGNTLLNFCGFTANDLEYITDTTPQKIGLLTPGSHIPVVTPDMLKQAPPDYVLLLAWNYRDFILEKEKDLRTRGVKFILPIPKVEII